MKRKFTYSILQYRHSFLTKEAVNIGILFYFPDENVVEFAWSNFNRVRCLYSNFDPSLLTSSINYIHKSIKHEKSNALFTGFKLSDNFQDFINNQLLKKDSTVLQFTDPIHALSVADVSQTVKNYVALLLPGNEVKKNEVVKHNEAYISREYIKYLTQINRVAENKLKRDIPIITQNISLKFDYSWQNGTLNLVKPLSFDLKEHADIQNKSAQFFGYFTLLKDYAVANNCRFDLLVAKPQDRKLYQEYDKALNTLHKIEAPKRIIKDGELKSYSQETIENLLKYN